MSITKWFAIGCALTFGTSALSLGAARAGDASVDARTARAFHVGSASGDPARWGFGEGRQLVALGASDGASDAADVRGEANAGGLALASPMGFVARAPEPSGPLGASDGASDADLARAGRAPARTAVAEDGGRTGESKPFAEPAASLR